MSFSRCCGNLRDEVLCGSRYETSAPASRGEVRRGFSHGNGITREHDRRPAVLDAGSRWWAPRVGDRFGATRIWTPDEFPHRPLGVLVHLDGRAVR